MREVDEGSVKPSTTERRDLWLHVALFVVVNVVYLSLAWPVWLWVTAIWAVGLGVHAMLVFGRSVDGQGLTRFRRRRAE